MPWASGEAFAKKHNKKLHGAKATKAKDVAEAMLRRGVPEGEAIATANARAKGQKRKAHRNPFKGVK